MIQTELTPTRLANLSTQLSAALRSLRLRVFTFMFQTLKKAEVTGPMFTGLLVIVENQRNAESQRTQGRRELSLGKIALHDPSDNAKLPRHVLSSMRF